MTQPDVGPRGGHGGKLTAPSGDPLTPLAAFHGFGED
jgi:hypothetical protein